ncbi:MAG: hypothetical protein QW257_00190 [Candidatus Micrarchaeaceae archaeon]
MKRAAQSVGSTAASEANGFYKTDFRYAIHRTAKVRGLYTTLDK